MKIEVPHNVLLEVLERGGAATTTREATDSESVKKQPLLRCVKMTIDGSGVWVESSSPSLSIKSCLPKDQVKVSDGETICLEIPDVIANLKSLMFPHTVTIGYDPDQKRAGEDIPLRSTINAVNAKGREAFSWTFDTFGAKTFPKVSYPTSKSLISIKVASIKKALAAVAFTTNPDDYTGIFNNVAICPTKKGLYVAASDNHRGAVVKIVDEVTVGKDAERILVSAEVLERALACFSEAGTIHFNVDDTNEQLVISEEGSKTIARLAMPPLETRKKYPDIIKIMNNTMDVVVEISDKDEFLQAMTVLKKAEVAEFEIRAGAEEVPVTFSRRHKPAKIGCEKIKVGLEDGKISLSIKFLGDILSKLEGKQMKLSFFTREINDPERGKIKQVRAVVQDKDEPDYFYLMQRVRPPAL